MTVDITVSGARENGDLHLVYEIGGKETTYTGLDHDDFHTTAHWDGDKLVFNTVEHERGHINKSTETWTLTEEGHTLKRVKQEEEAGEHSRIYVLEKL